MAIDWKGVKNDFEKEEGVSIRGLAKRHGCSPSAVRNRIKKEGWKCKRKAPGKGRKKECSLIPPKHEDVLDDHRSLWKGVKKRLVKGLRNNDVKLGLEELKVAKIAGEVLSSVIKGERLAWGLEAGAGEATGGLKEADDEEQITCEMERVTAPQGTDEALDGG